MDVTKIKKLREQTGVSISDCREALEKNAGDLTKAQNWLKIQGIENATKKAERATTQGIIETYVHGNGRIAVMVEILCETDFVAKTPDFKNLAHEIALQISAMNPKNKESLLNQEYIRDPKTTINELVKLTIAKLGENIRIGRFTRLTLGE